jgi:hypothetical protein
MFTTLHGGMNERMAGPMKTRKDRMKDELRPEYDLGQLLIQINLMRLPMCYRA